MPTTETPVHHDIRELEAIEFRLAQIRDELRLKAYRARPGHDPWDRLESKWQRLRSRIAALREAGSARDEAWEALHVLARELGQGYERLRAASPVAAAADEL